MRTATLLALFLGILVFGCGSGTADVADVPGSTEDAQDEGGQEDTEYTPPMRLPDEGAFDATALPDGAPTYRPTDTPATPLAEEARAIFGDRLRARFPAGTELDDVQRGIMSGPLSTQIQQAATFALDDADVTLVFREMGATARQPFAARVRYVLFGEDAVPESVVIESALWGVDEIAAVDACRTEPNEPEGTWVRSTFFVLPDGHVDVAHAYLREMTAAGLAAATAMTGDVFRTLRVGERVLHVSGGQLDMGAWEGEEHLVLDMPTGYLAFPQEGPDFAVYYVQEIVPLAETGEMLGVYVGGHPSARGYGDDGESEGTLFGESCEWRQSAQLPTEDDPHGTWSEETMVRFPGSDYWVLHLFARAPSPQGRARLRAIAETLALVAVEAEEE